MKKTKSVLTAILLVASTWLAKSQSCPSTSCTVPTCEYICNGSFDIRSSDPTTLNQMNRSCGWGAVSGTPDFYTSNAGAWVDIPCNLHGIRNDNIQGSGSNAAYAGFIGNSNQIISNEYLGCPLKSTLTTGTYVVSFYLSLADISTANVDDRVGFQFYSSTFGNWTTPITFSMTNQTAAWTQYTYTYTAIGDETLFQIGAFPNNFANIYSATSSLSLCTGPTSNNAGEAYYYLDDVSIKRLVTTTVSASSISGCSGETFTLTATGADTYTWNPGGLTGASVAVTPTSTTVYTVNGSTTGSCVVTVQTITVSPYACCANPAANNITLRDVNLVATGGISWTTLVAGGFYTGNINIPTGGIITNTLTIVNTLSISTPVTFYNCNIVICEDDIIKQYSTTTINQSLLKGDVTTLWTGIQTYNDLTVSNSWFEDAYLAIDQGQNFTGVATHPRLIIDNVLFNKNYRCIGLGTTQMNPDYLKITGCLFSSRAFGAANYTTTTRYNTLFPNPAAKPPAKLKGSSVYGITANSIRSDMGIIATSLTSNATTTVFTIGDATTGTPSLNINRFDYINEGIVNKSSRLYIINNIFSNIINTGLGNTLGAIYHDNLSGNTETNVGGTGGGNYKNVFNMVRDGVGAVRGGQLFVKFNDFNGVNRYGVAVTSWSASSAATQTVFVTNNSFSTTSYAFYANDNRTITATVASNTLVQTASNYTATGYGTYINEIAKPITATYYVNNNNFKGALNSIYVINTRNARVVNNTVQVIKPSGTTVNAPVWIDNSDYCTIKGNTVSCNPTNSGDWHTMGILNNASIYNTIKCNSITAVGACLKFGWNCNPTSVFLNTFNNVSTDPCLFGIWADSYGESGNIGHYNSITTNWEQSDDFWGDFNYGVGGADTKCQISSNHTSHAPWKIYYDAGKLAASYQPSVNINTYNIGLLDYSQSYAPTVSSYSNSANCGETSRLDLSGNTGKNTGNNIELENEWKGYKGEYPLNKKRIIIKSYNASGKEIPGNEQAFDLVDSLMTAYSETRNGSALNTAKNTNASINPINPIEQTQKSFNAIYCVSLESDSLVSGNQVQDLKDLASLCPFTDGLAVYQARALVRKWDDSTRYYNACEINDPGLSTEAMRFAANNASKEILPTVYPNPSNGKLMVENSPENSTFELYDVMGRKVYSNTLNGNVTQLDLSSFNNGNYLFRIVKDGKTIKQDKLMITK